MKESSGKTLGSSILSASSDEGYFEEFLNHNNALDIGSQICVEFVERHGGSIWVESLPNEGRVVKFTIPAK
jgi:light-regulated signal transduction histidine kinase (bacteriophytochrome)